MPTTYHAKLGELGKNIWWAWQPEIVTIFRDIDVDLWRKCNHNPVAFLQAITPERVAARCAEMSFEPRIDSALARLNDYVKSHRTWAEAIAGPLHARPVCYFSAEFGLHESLPLYSGGLGVLAGDHLKTASDLGIPTVGIGLFYAQGYFQQTLDEHGNQQEHYPRNPADKMPFVHVKDRAGKPLIITVETPTGDIHAGVWELPVGRIRLLLLDSDVDGNSPADRELTARLYGGDRRVRIRQELLLGVLNDPKRPVQLVFAGKAHPQDEPGKDFIRHVFRAARDPRFRGKVVFIENYDINVARHMVQGVDVWLNNPLRPLEACGTSGEKVILNGGLNFSTLDGWWAEGYDGRNGFAIGDTRVHSNFDVQLQRDSDSLYDVLENQIVPTFFDRNSHGYPHEWLSRVKHSIRSMAWRFCSDRMLMDYMLKLYLPASTGLQS